MKRQGNTGLNSTLSCTFVISCITLFIMSLLLLPSTEAFTVSPASQDLAAPGDVTFVVRNPEPETVDITVSLAGALTPYAQTEEHFVLPSGESHTLRVSIADPTDLGPGYQELLVELSAEPAASGTVAAAVTLAPKVRVLNPYEGAYLDFSWSIQDKKRPLRATIMIQNHGLDVLMAKPVLYLENEDGRARAQGPDVLVPSLETQRVEMTIPADELQVGVYAATLEVETEADAAKYSSEEQVWVGLPTIILHDLKQSAFMPGEIGRLTLQLNSDWNAPLPVTIDAVISDETRSWTLDPVTIELSPDGSAEFLWDSTGGDFGTYSLAVHIAGDGFQDSLTHEFSLKKQKPISLVAIVAVVLLVLLIIWQFVRMRHR